MIGHVVGLNRVKGFVAILVDDGEYAVVELLGSSELEMKDEVSGDLHQLGRAVIYRNHPRRALDVYFQDCHCSKERARKLLGAR